jgi:uncharacterized protein
MAGRSGWASFIADRLSDFGIVVLCACNVIIVGAFFFSAASLSANTAPPTTILSATATGCSGENLVARLEQENPQLLAEIRAQAAQTINGRSIFWRVSRPDTKPSYLFGTMHSADPRINRFPGNVASALENSDAILIENTEALDKQGMMQTMLTMKEYTLLLDGDTLDDHLTDKEIHKLKDAAEKRNLPWMVANRMQPWLVTAMIAVPACDLAARTGGAQILDNMIGEKAAQMDKALIGLETVEEQFRAVSSIPFEFHITALKETLQLGVISEDLMETTKTLYLDGKTAMMLPLVRAFAPRSYEGKGYNEFQELLLTRRNHTMMRRAMQYLEKGNAFMAVGALHLPGEQGLINLLRRAGFIVEPVAMQTG